MKVHFYKPNPIIFQKKHLNDVKVFFFPFTSSHHHNFYKFFLTSKNMGLGESNLNIEMDFTNLKF
jgi:hypothetical protein